jgi:hypothetical protein
VALHRPRLVPQVLPFILSETARPIRAGEASAKEAQVAPKKPANSGKDWGPKEVAQLKKELRSNTPTRLMGHHLKRSPDAGQQKASSLGLSTKPTNKSPFGTGGERRGR